MILVLCMPTPVFDTFYNPSRSILVGAIRVRASVRPATRHFCYGSSRKVQAYPQNTDLLGVFAQTERRPTCN